MANVICPQCGERLEIPSSMLGGDVRCGACQSVFTAPPDRAAAPRAVPRARRADEEFPAHVDAYNDAPPRRRAGRRTWLWILLGGFGLSFCVCCGVAGFIGYDFMSPDYVPYTSADARFTGKFPGPVSGTVRRTGRGMETVPALEANRTLAGQPIENFFVAYFDLTAADRRKGTDKILTELADGLKKTVPGSVEVLPRVQRVQDGHEAMELGLDLPDGRHTIARIVIANNRAYIVGVSGPGAPGNAPWVDDYLDGFRPTAKEGDDKKDNVPIAPKDDDDK